MKLSGACTACEGQSHAARRTNENRGVERQQQTPAFRAKAATATTRSNAELTVFTAEGDKVTLSASYSAEAGRVNYGIRGGENGRVRGDLRYAQQQASVNVSVEGDLSADELADIQKLAEMLGKASNGGGSGRGGIGTVNGEQDEAGRRVEKAASKLDSLQSFEYSYTSTVEYSYASIRQQRAQNPYERELPVFTPLQEQQTAQLEAAA